jgi:PAS domain S-box-containing protein
VFAQAPALVAVTVGPEHRFVLANPGFEDIVGRGDLVGRTVWEALPELEAQGIFALFDGVYATGEPYVANEHRVLLPRDGAEPYEGWYNFVHQPLTDASGAVYGILQHAIEVTAQVRARQAIEAARTEAERTAAVLAQSESKLRFALAVAELGAWDLDLTTQQAWRDPRHDQVFGYAELLPEWTYEMFLEHVVPEDRERVTASFGTALDAGTAWDFTCRIRRADGAERWILARGEPITDAAGTPVRLVGIVRDITAEREAEAERERLLMESEAARAEAEAANRAKSEFLAVMSHELRTPLNAISGYTDILEMGIHGPVTEAQRQALGRIQKSQRHLLGLINEVLNYARLESGAVRYEIEDVRVREEFAAAEALIAPQIRAEELTLTVEDCAAELAVRADPEKLRQILINLLSNAAKFTDPGGRIELGCDVRAERVHVWVRDTGIGIPPDKLEAIFEPFVQVRSDLTRIHEGTGLGLAISRDLARGMGGDLTAESIPGEGSTFTLHLPRSDPGAP